MIEKAPGNGVRSNLLTVHVKQPQHEVLFTEKPRTRFKEVSRSSAPDFTKLSAAALTVRSPSRALSRPSKLYLRHVRFSRWSKRSIGRCGPRLFLRASEALHHGSLQSIASETPELKHEMRAAVFRELQLV